MSQPKQIFPDCDICSECRDHASFVENEDGEAVSECCDAPPCNVDIELDMER